MLGAGAGTTTSRALGCLLAIMALEWLAMLALNARALPPSRGGRPDDDAAAGGDEALAALAARLLGSETSLQTLLLSLETDASFDHRILRDAVPAADRASGALTLCTQASTAALPSLVALAEAHAGPVSAAVFVAERSPSVALAAIALLRRCSAAVRRHVTFHLVFINQAPAQQQHYSLEGLPPAASPLASRRLWPDSLACSSLRGRQHLPEAAPGSLAARLGFGGARAGAAENYALSAAYPNNLLRNVARRGSRTRFMAVVDVDLVPAQRSAAAVARAAEEARRRGMDLSKTAFVLPAFEMAEGRAPPADRDALLAMLASGAARPFYRDACWKCQRPTNYDRWQEGPAAAESGAESSSFYAVGWTDPWEPFYAALDGSCPPYDERFRQYGFNRISQVCETHIAGYHFLVLYDAFVVHRGFKQPDAFHATKQAELDANRDLFRLFKRELKVKYGASRRRC